MGCYSGSIFYSRFVYLILGSIPDHQGLLPSASNRVITAHKPATAQAHQTHFNTFLYVLIFYNLPKEVSAHNLILGEFLSKNNLCSKVVGNYFSSVASLAHFNGCDTAPASHPTVLRFLRSIIISKLKFQAMPQMDI